jgi:hypothetical protein
MLRRIAFAAAAAALSLAPLIAATAATKPDVNVLAVQPTVDRQVSLVADVQPLPVPDLAPGAVSVTAAGSQVPTRLTPVLSARSSISLVVDASAGGASSFQHGGQSGVASFLLQVPPDSATSVVADRQPPAVISPSTIGVSDDLRAASDLTSGGGRSTSSALSWAVRQATPWPSSQPVIVLYTSAPDAGGEPAQALGERLRQAHAVLAVVNTSPTSAYWSQVANYTGGLEVRAPSTQAISAFDHVADALRARYTVTFARPAAGEAASLLVTTPGGTTTVPLALPSGPAAPIPTPASTQAAANSSSGSSSSTHGAGPWWAWLLGVAALAVAATTVIISRGRRDLGPVVDPPARAGKAADERPADERPADERPAPEALPGVRVFDVADPAEVREITGSLFEPRSVRDAREGAQDEHTSEPELTSEQEPEPSKLFDIPKGPRSSGGPSS